MQHSVVKCRSFPWFASQVLHFQAVLIFQALVDGRWRDRHRHRHTHVYASTSIHTHAHTHTCTRACARNRDRDCLIYLVDFSKIFCVYVCVLRFHYTLSLCLTGDFSIHRVSNYVCFFILNIEVFPEIWKIRIHCLFPFPFHFSFLVWHFDSIICMSCFRILYPCSTPCCISVISGLYSGSFISFHLRLIWSLIHHWAFKNFFFI